MKTVVLSALTTADKAELAATLQRAVRQRGGEVRWVDLAEVDFHPCMACGRCGRTGRCILKDELTGIIAEIAGCDRLVLATPVFLGVHAPLMKKAVDRFLPLAGELFTVRKGEMHHRSRLERPFSIVGIGVLEGGADPAEADIFAFLISRHAVNMACPQHAAIVLPPDAEGSMELEGALDRTGRGS